METTTDTTSTTPSFESKRSTFLTVICILTFIGSGWGIVGCVQSYTTADATSAMVSEKMADAQDKMDNQDTPSFVKGIFSSVSSKLSPDNIRKSAIFKFISCLLTLIGGIMMWSLRRSGFYLYIAGIVVLVATPIIVLGGGFVGATGAVWSAIIGVVFIAMYAANLKYMTN